MHWVAMPRFLPSRFMRIDEMQHDAVAAGADRMAEADRAAIDVESRAVDFAGSALKTEHLAAEFVVSHAARQPSTCAANASFNSHSSMSSSPACAAS